MAQPAVTASVNPATPTSPAKMLALSPYFAINVQQTPLAVSVAGSMMQRDQIIASYNIRPKAAVTIKVNSPPRPGTFPQSIPAGTHLFQVHVDNGVAYCAPWAEGQGQRETQCFRDIDGDGTFDGGYRTNRPLVGTSLYLGRIALLSPVPKLAYEAADPSVLPSDVWNYRFVRARGNVAEFKPQFGTNRQGFEEIKCVVDGQTPCNLGIHSFVLEAQGGNVVVKSVAQRNDALWLRS